MTERSDTAEPPRHADGLRERLTAVLVEAVPAAMGAFRGDGAELVANEQYRKLQSRGLVSERQAHGEREVCLEEDAFLAMRFPLELEDPDAYGEVLFDVSAHRLRALSAALGELEQLKAELVTTISHELRTPLSSILGYCELLGDGEFGELDPGVQRMVGVIARNSYRLSRLLEDMLLLAQLDSACPPPAPEDPIDLREVLSAVAERIGSRAAAAGVAVQTELPEDAVRIPADRAQLQHAVMNLASNAVKFSTTSGTVRLRLAVEGTDAVLEVIDNGVGIDPEDLPRLGDRFYRSAAARVQQVQGAGVGLSVVQSVVQRHGGTLELQSAPGHGTTARVRLPLSRKPA